MLVSLKELNKFIPNIKLDLSIEKVINNLGYEVESIEPFSDVKGVKFAKILDVYKNNDAKNLNVVSLQTNSGNLIIQTTASNAQKGYWTVIFPVGSSKGEIVFEAKKMAGIVSQGMMAGYSELGYNPDKLPFNKDHLIMLNDKNINLETDPMEYLNLNDYILDITTPANRSDINSYYVLAQEIAAYYDTEFKWFNYKKTYKKDFLSKIKSNKNKAHALSFIEVKNANKNTKFQDILFLAKHNIEAKNIWAIDITNINLLLNGTPTHAYDSTKIGNKLECDLYTGKVEILGSKELEVKNVLAIKDEKNVISLASVMGLVNTSVSNESDQIAFEIGAFDNKLVRHGAREIKIDSPSSIQAGRQINTQMVINGMKYLQYRAHLDGLKVSQIIGLPRGKKGTAVLQNRKKLAIYSNSDFANLKHFEHVEQKLQKLGFIFTKNRVICPNYRSDIENFEDIIEEYFRYYGYDKFEAIAPNLIPYKVSKRDITKELLSSQGYKEVRTYTLVSEVNNILNPFKFKNDVKLETFVSKEREVIRNSIITSLLETAEYNLKRKINKLSIFEKGMINYNNFVFGLLSNEKTFDQMKQDILNVLKLDNVSFVEFNDDENIHHKASAKIYQKDKFIGWIGKVSPKLSINDFLVSEFINLKDENQEIQFREYSNDPLKTIDLTFEIGKDQSISSTIMNIKNVAQVFTIEQIDDYHRENSRSVTLRITAESNEIDKINATFNK